MYIFTSLLFVFLDNDQPLWLMMYDRDFVKAAIDQYLDVPPYNVPIVLGTGAPTEEEVANAAKNTGSSQGGGKRGRMPEDGWYRAEWFKDRLDPEARKYGNMSRGHYMRAKDYLELNQGDHTVLRMRQVIYNYKLLQYSYHLKISTQDNYRKE